VIRLLYIGMRYDYGDPDRGDCFEYVHFHDTLSRMPEVNLSFFPYDVILREKGREEMNRMLRREVETVHPDLCFFVLFTDEISEKTIAWVTEQSAARTVNWFTDDHWRFEYYSRHWAPLFHYVATTDNAALEKYHALGVRSVLKTQWGFNHHRFRRVSAAREHDVTFVGQVHSGRLRTVKLLREQGFDVRCWGRGWKGGRISFEGMLRVFSSSAINLNFSEGSAVIGLKSLAKVFLNRRADDSLHLRRPGEMMAYGMTLARRKRPQIKGRTFEVPGAGGFLLSGEAENLSDYFTPSREIVTFSGSDDLIEKIRYYLSHDSEREAIREAGYARACRDHTYEARFRELFRGMGFHEKI
jgi:spore maturation protein CgeB